MKSLIISYIVLLGIVLNQCHEIPSALKAHVKKLHDMCLKQHSVQPVLIERMVNDGHFAEDDNFKCYFHCILDKSGLIDDKNVIHLDYLKEVLREEYHEIIDGLVSNCGTQAGVDGCDIAFNTIVCYKTSDPMLFAKMSTIIL